jgi:hypothetical protein
VELRDDPSIRDEARLWRRISPVFYPIDPVTGKRRLSSAAFDDSKDRSPMSVVLADREDAPPTPELWTRSFPGYGVAELTAGGTRAYRQGVAHTPEDGEPAHGSVFGKKTGAVKNRLREIAALLVVPQP